LSTFSRSIWIGTNAPWPTCVHYSWCPLLPNAPWPTHLHSGCAIHITLLLQISHNLYHRLPAHLSALELNNSHHSPPISNGYNVFHGPTMGWPVWQVILSLEFQSPVAGPQKDHNRTATGPKKTGLQLPVAWLQQQTSCRLRPFAKNRKTGPQPVVTGLFATGCMSECSTRLCDSNGGPIV
jgi:hypothetical protein